METVLLGSQHVGVRAVGVSEYMVDGVLIVQKQRLDLLLASHLHFHQLLLDLLTYYHLVYLPVYHYLVLVEHLPRVLCLRVLPY